MNYEKIRSLVKSGIKKTKVCFITKSLAPQRSQTIIVELTENEVRNAIQSTGNNTDSIEENR